MNQAANNRLVSFGGIERPENRRADQRSENAARIGCRSITTPARYKELTTMRNPIVTIARLATPAQNRSHPTPARRSQSQRRKVNSFPGNRNCRKPGRNVASHQ